MRPIKSEIRNTEKAKPSSHDKKIQKRADKFMELVSGLKFSATGKLSCLKFLLDKTAGVISDTKAAGKFNDKFHAFTEELDLAVRRSKREENQQEFLELVQDSLAREGLGAHYDEYAALKRSGATARQLISWISDIQKEINPPKVRQRSQSQPTMFVSASTPTQAIPTSTTRPLTPLPSSAPVFVAPAPTVFPSPAQAAYPMPNGPVFFATPGYYGPPPGQQAYPATAQYPATPSAWPNPAMQAQAYPQAVVNIQPQPQPQPQIQIQPQPQPQPQAVAFTEISSDAGQPVFSEASLEVTLNQREKVILDAAVENFKSSNFNAKGTLTVLKYLINSERPPHTDNPQAKRFNDKLDQFINFFEQHRRNILSLHQPLWLFQFIVNMSSLKLSAGHVGDLVNKTLYEDRQSVSDWLSTLYNQY